MGCDVASSRGLQTVTIINQLIPDFPILFFPVFLGEVLKQERPDCWLTALLAKVGRRVEGCPLSLIFRLSLAQTKPSGRKAGGTSRGRETNLSKALTQAYVLSAGSESSQIPCALARVQFPRSQLGWFRCLTKGCPTPAPLKVDKRIWSAVGLAAGGIYNPAIFTGPKLPYP